MSQWTQEKHEEIKENLRLEFYTGHHRDADAAEEALEDCLREIERLQTPYCMGRATIQLVAKEGQAIIAGKAFIAADDLLYKDPYAEIERLKAELEENEKRLIEMQEAAIVFATQLRDAAALLGAMPNGREKR